MPVDWEKFDSEMGSIIEDSASATDEKLASRISSITRMTDEEVQKLFPDPADVEKLIELMKIVKSSQRRNNNKWGQSTIVSNINKCFSVLPSVFI